jgi:hypothetical protein
MLPPPAAARIACLIADHGDRHGQPRALPATFLLAILAAFLAIAFHAAPPAGSLATPAVGASGSGEVRTEEPRMRFNSKLGAMAGAVAVSVGGQAVAQDAVQWRVKDGGNGHWYAKHPSSVPTDWNLIVSVARSQGAELIAISSAAEHAFVANAFGSVVIGLRATAGSTVFTWSNGEPVVFSNWGVASCPNGPYPNNSVVADRLVFMIRYDCVGQAGLVPSWDDYPPSELGPTIDRIGLEWSADCNNDGLVDYGQIRTGDLPDANNNNIPDCCEQGVSCSPCAADIVRDGVVNGIDLAAVLTNWGTAGGSLNADVNQDGVVNGSDLAVVLAGWGPCP